MTLVPVDATLGQHGETPGQMETSLGRVNAVLCLLKTALDRSEKALVQEKKMLAPMDMTLGFLDKKLL